jgi:hypothetical protein
MCRTRVRHIPGAAWAAALALALTAGPANAVELKLSLEGIESPDFTAKAVTATVRDKTFQFSIGELSILGRTWRNLGVTCRAFRLESDVIECSDGTADTGAKMPVAFSYRPGTRSLELTVEPRAKETWRLQAGFAEGARRMELTVENASLASFASWLPEAVPRPGAGTLAGRLMIEGSERRKITGTIAVRGAGFADASGLHAGEKVDADLSFAAQEAAAAWRWQGTLEWKGGEVFWQPLYLRASGQTVRAEGAFDDRSITVSRSTTALPGVGEVEAVVEWDRRAARVQSADVRSGRLDGPALYTRVLQPHFAGTSFADMRVAGSLEIASLRIRAAAIESLEIVVHDVSFEDLNRRFAVFGANGRIPWHHSDITRLDFEIKGGEALGIPFGAVKLPLTMRGMRFRLENVEIPVLDGRLAMNGFATDPPGDEDWRWSFSGALTPVSTERFTQAFGWPTMHGVVSMEIPKVAYSRSTLQVGGALLFKVFDGTVEMRNLTLAEPFGKAPRLTADLEMRNLDLDLVTRTFSFGKITGRVDATVAGLELVNWQPTRFDARIASSPGDYPRKISQAAVENITALGGAGASAALQRTFLRFFEEFGYQKLGWSCRLEHNVCRMGGSEDAQEGYVIVKGSGVPALSVMGYNRSVNWTELVERLKRVVQNNVHAVVR